MGEKEQGEVEFWRRCERGCKIELKIKKIEYLLNHWTKLRRIQDLGSW